MSVFLFRSQVGMSMKNITAYLNFKFIDFIICRCYLYKYNFDIIYYAVVMIIIIIQSHNKIYL